MVCLTIHLLLVVNYLTATYIHCTLTMFGLIATRIIVGD